jgi:sigma-B regulation protein RsbU (phosphoserine phosphatase)
MKTFAPTSELRALEKLRDAELEEARALQSVMLPRESLRARGVTISHQFQPVSAVGGDFLDYFELSDGCIGLYLGDVSGKGLPAAFFGALAVGTLRGVHKTGTPTDQVLATMNRRLMIRGLPTRHAALQYAVFNPSNREIQISSAGMPGPLHLTGKGCRVLKMSGIPPGLWPCASYDVTVLQLEPGDSVLFCTDGVTDSMNLEEESFGMERLVAICDEHLADTPTHLLQSIFAAVESFSQGREPHDDMARRAIQLFGIKVCKTEAKRDCGNKNRTGTCMRVPKQECSDCASPSGFPIDTVDPLQ